jgi:hypothetical protein
MSKKQLIDAICALNEALDPTSLEGKSEVELDWILTEERAKQFRPR